MTIRLRIILAIAKLIGLRNSCYEGKWVVVDQRTFKDDESTSR